MKSSVICLFCLRTLALAARFELNHLEEGLEVGQTVLIVSGKYKGCQGLVERVVGSKIQVLRRCSDGRAGDGKSWWYRSGQVEELEEESLLVEKEDEVVSTSSLSLLADEAYRSDHPYCDKYKDLPPLYPGAHVPELRQRPVLRRGRPFRLTGAVGASAEVGLIGTVPRPVELSSIIQVDLPPTAPVGEYELRTMDDENKTLATFTFLVIFNPFTCPACPEHADVDEDYVLGDEGLLWQGLSDDYTANHWTFEPFRGANLLISLSLLAPLPPESRGDVATLTRFLTNAVGEKVCYGKWGEGDYLKGRPKKGYTCRSKQHVKRFPQRWAHRCRDPSTWDSSSALLEQHWGLVASGSSATAVQYCQCFVFSGVLTTIGRSLGLATRSVTNFQSAHDVNGDRGVSRFFFTTPEGVWEPVEFTDDLCPKWCNRKEKAEKKGCDLLRCTKALSRGRGFQKDCKPCMPCVPCHSVDDSVWSFHVWNEIYFSRGRHAADGWQALDATPQELSGGKFQMGPASVQEVRKGNSDCYDTDFVISEVNGDTKLYVYQVSDLEAATKRKAIEVGDFVLHRGDPLYLGMRWYMDPFGDAYNTVGFKVVTKKPGPVPEACWRNSRLCQSEELDLTGSYKRCPDVHDRKPSCAAGYSKPISCEAAEVVPSFLEEEIQEAMVQRHLHELGENTDVEANFSDFVGPVELGRDLPLRILFRNRGHEKRRLQLGITAVVSDYRGVPVIHMETRSRKYAVKLPLDGRKTLLKRHLELLPGEVTSFGHVVKRKNLDRGTLQSMEVNAADGRFFVQFHVSVVTDRGQRFGHEPRRLLREPE